MLTLGIKVEDGKIMDIILMLCTSTITQPIGITHSPKLTIKMLFNADEMAREVSHI